MTPRLTTVPATEDVLDTRAVQAPPAWKASGIVNTSYQVGSALGLAAMTALATSQGADRLGDAVALTDGYSAAFLGAAGIAAAGGLPRLRCCGSPSPSPTPRETTTASRSRHDPGCRARRPPPGTTAPAPEAVPTLIDCGSDER